MGRLTGRDLLAMSLAGLALIYGVRGICHIIAWMGQ